MFKHLKLRALTSGEQGFIKNASVLVGGTALSQLIGFAFMLILTRIYSPEEFGTYSVLLAIATPVGIVGCLRFEMAIMVADDESGEKEAAALLSIVSAITITSISIIALPFLAKAGLLGDGVSQILYWQYLISVCIFLQAISLPMRMWALREKKYRLGATTEILQRTVQGGLQAVVPSIGGLGAGGLVLGLLCGLCVKASLLGSVYIRTNKALSNRLKNLQLAALKFRNFPIYQVPGTLLNSIAREWPVLIIAASFGEREAGLYFLANKVVGMPLSIVGRAVSDVYYQEAALLNRRGKKGVLEVKVIFLLATLVIPVLLVLGFLGPNLLGFLLGDQWMEVGVLVQCMLPLIGLRFVAAPLAKTFSVYQKQKAGLVWQICFLCASFAGLYIGSTGFGLQGGLILYSIAGASMYGFLILLALKYGGGSLRDFITKANLGR